MTDSEMIEDRRSSGFRNAQKAVEQLVSNGLLDKSDIKAASTRDKERSSKPPDVI